MIFCKKKLNLVLDLDDTLIKSIIPVSKQDLYSLQISDNYLLDIEINGVIYCIFYRPFLFQFLKKWSETFNLYVYTHSTKIYCKAILECLKTKVSSLKIYRVHCRETQNSEIPLKNLDNLKLSRKNTIILDDNLNMWGDFTSNVLNIRPMSLIDTDQELIIVNDYLNVIDADYYKKSKKKFCSCTETNYDITEIIEICNFKYNCEDNNWDENQYNY